MSVANIILEPHRVRMVGDTVSYREKAPVHFHRKVRLARHAKVAFTVRGLVALNAVLDEGSDSWACFETAVQSIAAVLETAARFIGTHAEITVLGWHANVAKASRLLAKVQEGAVAVHRIDLTSGVYLAPTLGSHAIPPGLTDEQLVKIAILQQALALRHGLNMCVGGDVELTEITAAGISVRKIGEYPDKAMTAARIAKLGADDLEEVAA